MKLRLQGGLLYVPVQARNFEIEVGALDYGFPNEGILGVDFLLRVGAVIDLHSRELRSH